MELSNFEQVLGVPKWKWKTLLRSNDKQNSIVLGYIVIPVLDVN